MTVGSGSGPIPLVCVGIHNPSTGFARVLRELTRRFAGPFDVHWVGIGYDGPVASNDGVTVHPVPAKGGDVFGALATAALTERLGAPIVVILYDLWMLQVYGRTLPKLGRPPAIVAYFPVDGEVVDPGWLFGPLTFVDRFVCFTRFGKSEVDRSIELLRRGGARFTAQSADVIPHGVDADRFRPLPDGRSEARRRCFGDDPAWRDAFAVLNANRPTERKRIDLTLEGFALFARGQPDVRLILHHALMDPDERRGLVSQIDQLGLTGLVRLPEPGAAPLDDERLNLLYNACDVGLNTSMGEGWGLVPFEHASTGAAQVVPDNSVHPELWEGAAELVGTEDAGVPSFSPLRMRAVSAQGVAAAVDRLYRDPDYRSRVGEAGLANAHRPDYRWDAIATRWGELLREVTDERMAEWARAA